jgi:hypothetical protein
VIDRFIEALQCQIEIFQSDSSQSRECDRTLALTQRQPAAYGNLRVRLAML